MALLFKNCEITIHEARDVVLRSLAKTFFLSLDLYVSENKETDYSGLEFLAWKIISGTYGPYVQSRLDLHYDQILIDDDQDCVWIKVTVTGNASCHVGYYSCFYREIKYDGKKVKLNFTEKEKVFDPDDVYGDAPNPTIL